MKQPHIYVLPERFIKDPSVPLRWKLYTILNGFWVSGKPVFASNAYFAEKLGCTERHVQDCLLELEKMFLITRHGKSQNRRIIPGGHGSNSPGDEPRVRGGDEPSGVVRDEPRVHHISDSSSDNIPARAEDGDAGASSFKEREYTIHSDNAKPDKKNTPEMLEGYKVFDDNPARKTFHMFLVERAAMKVILEEYGLAELSRLYSIVKKHRGKPYCPLINSPSSFLGKSGSMEKFLNDIKNNH